MPDEDLVRAVNAALNYPPSDIKKLYLEYHHILDRTNMDELVKLNTRTEEEFVNAWINMVTGFVLAMQTMKELRGEAVVQ